MEAPRSSALELEASVEILVVGLVVKSRRLSETSVRGEEYDESREPIQEWIHQNHARSGE